MCVHRRCVVWLWTVECACTDGVLCGCGQLNFVYTDRVLCSCGQLNVRAQTVCCVAVGILMCVHRRCVVWLWAVECACRNGVLCGCGQLNERAQIVCCLAVGS